MKIYNFDKCAERRGTGSLKYDALQERYGNPDLLPLWVADMDFDTPDFIIDALRERLNHKVLGYTVTPPELWRCIQKWIDDCHGWKVEREWLTFIPGIVKGIGMVIDTFTSPGDKIIIQPPVYHPFRLVPEGNRRIVVNNPLTLNHDNTYSMNLSHLEQIIINENARLLILSNPHNPAGIVWDRNTLARVAEICHSHGVIVISDEIHCDMTLWGNRHIPFASVSPAAAACSITFGAPSKTFNIAGVVSSYAIVPDCSLRNQFYSMLDANELSDPGLFPPIATIAAFSQGNPWREQMIAYIEKNIQYVIDYCRQYIPYIIPFRPQASFLVWLDCRKLGLSQPELVNLFVDKAALALNDGSMFGKEGDGFMRMNIGTSRYIISDALDRLKKAVDSIITS